MSGSEIDVTDDTTGVRLVDFARARLAVVPVGAIGPLIAAGAVRVNARTGRIADRVKSGDRIAVDLAAIATLALEPEARAIAVHYEDPDLLIVDKPAGMHVHPLGSIRAGTLVNALLHYAGARTDQPWAEWRPHPAHRLDRGASGLVMIAKRGAIHDALRTQLASHQIERRYLAVVHGRIALDAGTIDAPLGRDPVLDYRRAVVAESSGGVPAVTHYRVIQRDADRTHVELELATGRTHQIRAHLASLGHPIVGDTLYERGDRGGTEIALRANELSFRHPRDRRSIVVASPTTSTV